MFGFDERYAMFDITPVENQFILDYLPAARGDYVKVYLYGLMRCYHPEDSMSTDRMSHELNMSEEDIELAFAYWERKGLVRRVSDKPPRWQYVNIKQRIFTGGDDTIDPEYEAFSNAVYDAFGRVRRLHGNELNTCFDWVEDLKLPTEVIIMLLNHMVDIKGRNFRISDASKIALRMAEEDIRTVEAAEAFFLKDGKDYAGIREILKKLGKNYAPSEAQIKMYQKWTREWRFTHKAILEALELTAKGDPSIGYLDGILNSLRSEAETGMTVSPQMVKKSVQRADELKTVLKALGRGEVNNYSLQLFDGIKAIYPIEVILMAAGECRQNKKDLDDMVKLLQSWKEKGLENAWDVEAYITAFHEQTAIIRELHRIWGTDEGKIGKTDRSLVYTWAHDLGFSREMILAVAPYAAEAKMPMAYLDRILKDYSSKGIRTPEQARHEHELNARKDRKNTGKTVIAQNYDQREYDDIQRNLIEAQRREAEEYLRRNGGVSDA